MYAIVCFLSLLSALDIASQNLKLVIDKLNDTLEEVLVNEAPTRFDFLVMCADRSSTWVTSLVPARSLGMSWRLALFVIGSRWVPQILFNLYPNS